mmetsp:Transcript_22232/g.57098  ORF Transcript_22232/g.57098 Transcript_22232/m.57098 type:complete len:665 (-) Transcript_22232:272-2266(-)
MSTRRIQYSVLIGSATACLALIGLAVLIPSAFSGSFSALQSATSTKSAPFSFGFSLCNPDPNLLIWDSDTTQLHNGMTLKVGWLKVPIIYEQPGLESIGKELGFSAIRVSAATTCEPGAKVVLTHCGGPGTANACLNVPAYQMTGLDNIAITQRGLPSQNSHYLSNMHPLFEPFRDVDADPPSVPFVQADGEPVKPFPAIMCYPWHSFRALKWTKDMFDAAELDFEPYAEVYGKVLSNNNWHAGAYLDPLFMKLTYMLRGAAAQHCRREKDYALGTNPVRGQMAYQDFVGTVDLAHDMDTFRKAIGVDKLSVWGFSYGTEVGATYASIFPDNVDRLVLDGNVPYSNRLYENAETFALAYEHVWQGLENACTSDFLNEEEPRCVATPYPTEKLLKLMGESNKTKASLLNLLENAFDSDGMWNEGVEPIGAMIMACIQSAYTGKGWTGPGCAYKDQPPFIQQQLPENWLEILDTLAGDDKKTNDPIALVRAVDMPARLTSDDTVALWMRLQKEHPIGFIRAINIFRVASSPTVPRPVPMYGSSLIKPLIIANLHDPATTITGSQYMSGLFPQGSLMTWQGYAHSLIWGGALSPDDQKDIGFGWFESAGYGAYDCMQKLQDYLQHGTLPSDGYVCPTNGPAARALSLEHAKAGIGRGMVLGVLGRSS